MYRIPSVLLVMVLTGGCAALQLDSVPSAPQKEVAPGLYAPPIESEYKIQVGDRIVVASYYDSHLNQDVVVRPDGRISLLLMGDVYVAGVTPTRLDEMVTKAYSRVVEAPEITVVIKEFTSSSIYVGGEVRRQAAMPIRGSITVMQAITAAGGFLPTANKKQVLILRKQPDGQYITYQLDTDRILVNGAPSVYLQRTDIIYVPETTIANVGHFVDQYINKVIPEAIRFSYSYTRVKDDDTIIQVTP